MSMSDVVQGFAGALAQLSKVDADAEFGMLFVIRGDWADAAADITVRDADAPFAFRVIDAVFENQAANGVNVNSIQVCKAAGASGITDVAVLNNIADKALVRSIAINDANTIAEGGSLFLESIKAGGTMGGTAWIYCVTL